jgi:5-methylcytosine-specific restriction endonuclease McrA
LTGRELHKEWIGKTARSVVPDYVLDRLLERCGGVCQGPCGQPLVAGLWQRDHIIPLRDWPGPGHGNRESNLQILCTKVCHRPKTRLENMLRAKALKKRSVLFFPKKQSKHPVRGWRKMDGTPVYNPAYWNRGGRGGGRRT